MELLVLVILLALYFVGFCMMLTAFALSRRFPIALPLIKAGAYLAAGAGLAFVVVPGIVPWWEYDALSYWTRALAVVIPVVLTFVLLRQQKSRRAEP